MVTGTVGAGSQVHPAAGSFGSHLAAVEELADVEDLADVEVLADVEDQTAVEHPTVVVVPSPVVALEGETGTPHIAVVD